MTHMDETPCRQLPPEILQRVVSLLPLVPLFRCRAVCKQWNGWISELHPQTPAQKTEIFIETRVSGTDHWFAFDTSINKWFKIDCRVLSMIEPHIGFGCTARATHKGLLLAGSVVGENLDRLLFVCNPVSRVHFGVIPDLGVEPYSYEIVVDDNNRSYKVYLLSVYDDFEYDRMVHVYNSNDMRWTLLWSIPELSDNCCAYIQRMVISEEFVHLLVMFEPQPEELKFHAILSYNMSLQTWVEHGWWEIPLFLRGDIQIGHMLVIRGQLLLVGQTVDVNRFRTNILVWKLSFGSDEVCVEIARMPRSISSIFRTARSYEIRVSGCGDRIFFLSNYSKMVTYCLLDDSWHRHPDLTAHDTLPEFVRCALFEKFMTLAAN